MALPRAHTRILNGGMGLIAAAGLALAVFGCSSDGPTGMDLKPKAFGNIDDLVELYGTGPGVKAAAYVWERTRIPLIFVRMTKTAQSAIKSAVDKTGVVGTLGSGAFIALSGTPLDSFEVVVVITTGGTTGASFSYKISLDGGVTFSSPVAQGTGLTIVPSGTGVTITLTTGKTVLLNDEFSFYTLPASETVLPVTITRSGTSTSDCTVSGTPEDAYQVVFEILEGGDVGTAGIIYRYSLDGGETYTRATQLGTEIDVDLIDDAIGGELEAGVSLTFEDGESLDAGDKITFATTGPQWQSSDAESALDNLRESEHKWAFALFEGDSTASKAGTIGAKMIAFEEDEDGAKRAKALLSVRDRGTRESLLTWRDRVLDDFSDLSSRRTPVGAGHFSHVTCPITGRRNRRPITWQVVVRLLQNAIDVDPGQVSLGALDPDVSIVDANKDPTEYNARLDPTLHDARFLTSRTWEELDGVYITRGNTFEGEGGDYTRIALLDVADEGARIQDAKLKQLIEIGFYVQPSTGPTPGALRPADANRIEREIRTALQNGIGSMVSEIKVAVDRTAQARLEDGTGKITVNTEIVPKVYVDEAAGTIRLRAVITF